MKPIISPSILSADFGHLADDIEMLEDLIAAAVNEAFRQMEADNSETMSKLTGGLGGALGGGLPF